MSGWVADGRAGTLGARPVYPSRSTEVLSSKALRSQVVAQFEGLPSLSG
jgi:hypothetical protein